MRVYETTFILSPQADDAAFDRQIKAVSELINRYNGKILEEDRWGVRRLAYAIKKFTQGYYTRIVFEGNNTLLKELDRFYRLEEPYIRNLTVGFEGKLKEKEKEEEESDSYRPHTAGTDSKTDTPPKAAPAAPATEEKSAGDKTEESGPADAETTEETATNDEEANTAESSDENVDKKEEEL
jgi:small subunit ribosomal protein S6